MLAHADFVGYAHAGVSRVRLQEIAAAYVVGCVLHALCMSGLPSPCSSSAR
jgi:hypothetical protein